MGEFDQVCMWYSFNQNTTYTVSATWEEKKLPKFVEPFQQHADWDHAKPVQNDTSTCAKWDQRICRLRPAMKIEIFELLYITI